jgi:glycosyltransferase involved in cell wall biosynthesis
MRGVRHRPVWIARIGSNPARHDSRFRAALGRRLVPEADHVVANSSGLAGAVAEFYGLERERVSTVPNLVDVDALDRWAAEEPQIRRSDEDPIVIAVGRLFVEKRYDLMIKAIAQVRRNHKVKLWICGEGPQRPALERQVRRLGLQATVRLLGHCDNPFALMRQAALFLMTSDHEGLPNALIEAQCLGLPAVSTRCPFGPEEIIVEGQSGLLVPVGDASAIAEGVMDLLAEPGRLSEMAENAKKVAQARFAAPAVARHWEELILDVADMPV